jgi:site-specific DNA recombinase
VIILLYNERQQEYYTKTREKKYMKKRVWCLYRVSTKKQVNVEDDIPMQRNACHNYVKGKPEWEITNELYEKGISGWSKKADERDELNTIKEAALKKEFDILLVFMLDRLGRREDESPLVVSFLFENGIDVWSVQEGQRSIESHVDKLITYIGFWQSSGESLKTSMRVKESKKQLSEQGYYQGGVPPYGYKVVETEERHWKNKDRFLKEIVPDEYESEIVKLIFDLYVISHCGYRKIADNLNSKGYHSRDGKPFRVNTIQRVLTNPICIGLKKYKSHGSDKETMPYNEKLRIISDDLYNKAEKIRNKRHLTGQNKEGIPMSGKLMFSGLARCGYCGSKLSGNYLYRKDYVNGKEYTNILYRYRCPLNKGSVAEKHEQNMWGAKKFDGMAIEHIKTMIEMIDNENFVNVNTNKKQKKIEMKRKNMENLIRERDAFQKQIDKLNLEIANALLGESSFTPEQLSIAIKTTTNKLENVNIQIEELAIEIEKESNDYSDINNLANELVNWVEKFEAANDDLKKAMLTRIVEKVDFYKGDIRIHLDAQVKEVLLL